VPIEIRRFGVGNRRPQGPPGTTGVSGQPIHSDATGVIAELAFGRGARIEPHSNPNETWFIVIEGGGWVGVGDERARVAAGEAVLWPAGVDHAAWTELSEMRALVVELPLGGTAPGIIEGRVAGLLADGGEPVERGDGELRSDGRSAPRYDPADGEPL
jgi:quercetin dioxygenase-like cupin family protein